MNMCNFNWFYVIIYTWVGCLSLKLDPHASAGVTAAFGLACAPLKVVTDAGGANCLILWESDTGSTMEKQSRNAGVESEQH